MTTTQQTAHIRSRIKHAGIKARVRIAPGGGALQVVAPAADAKFSADEQRQIQLIAKCNGFTFVRGLEIDLERTTNPHCFSFYGGASCAA
jgi:hypothetical protein